MKGSEIYDKYTSMRDYSGSKSDEYAQLLGTLSQVAETQDFFSLLEKAETQNRKLGIRDESSMNDEIVLSDIVII